MKKIPEELKKQGVRWVLINNNEKLLVGENIENIMYLKTEPDADCYLMGIKRTYTCKIENKEVMKELPQEPEKIPYTAETFPDNAIWIRIKDTEHKNKYNINIVNEKIFFITSYKCVINVKFDEFDEYEIGFLTKHHKLEWRPFYKIKE